MSAQEVKSEDLTYEIDGSAQTFRTITTFENSKITNTKIQQVIDIDLYNQRVADGESSFVTVDDNGLYYQTIRDKKQDTKYAKLDIRREFAKTGPNSFTNQLQNAQIDALKAEFTEDQQGSKDSFWRSQLSGNDNVARNPEPPPTEIATNYAIDEIKVKGRRRERYENLFYPEDITTSRQDRIRFTMFYQSGSRIGFDLNSSNPFVIGQKTTTNIEGSVTLPIQGGIADSNQVGYNRNSTLNPVQGALAAVALNPQAAVQNLIDVLKGDAADIQAAIRSDDAKATIGALRLFLAQSAVGAQGLVPRTTGAILNPNLELILEAPQLRSFNFTFTMSARSRTEATQIKKIIRFFKQGMSVKRSDTSLFIVSPNMFRINYLTGAGRQHPSIGRIKDCALTAINTEYTPDGTYMTFDDADRTMTSYKITMQFTELEPITEDDYGNSEDIAGTENFLLRPTIESEFGVIPDNQIGF
mgnify:CR=1 FL=1|tara:strand:+ start:58 stop:1470 length:1413 start_codon:yes stop_codon:yes gene_type:complete